MSESQKLIVIGNGMAAVRFLENMLKQDTCPYDITVFGSESHGGYNRILLSPLLSGEQTLEDIITHPYQWYEENKITLISGKSIIAIDRENKHITDNDNNQYSYDKLVIATGSNPFVPPIPGHDLENVYTYRTIEDVDNMMAISDKKSNAVVIGGGLLGLEVAYGLNTRGMDVTVLHLSPVLMENQLDEIASNKLIDSLQEKGIKIITEANTKSINGTASVESIELNDGTIIPADLVVIAVGIRPNISLAQASTLDCERGILVNDYLQTSDPNIYSIGECAQHNGITYGLVAPLYEQAEICANVLCGNSNETYQGSITATGLKVTGVSLFSAGQFREDDDCKLVKLIDDKNGVYRKLVVKDNKLIGALLYGDINGSLWYQELIQSKQDITPHKDYIMFGPDYIPETNSEETTSEAA
ncbi:MAG: NAD(P)/FAD-dependent oxidoreductase [Gammaproteobacteria bacterium]|jgi:nitrite reductase (NADH) large subunit